MKKLYIPMMLVAVAAITSCEKQPVAINEPTSESYVYTICASVPEDADVKSEYDADGHFSWSSGDAISVLFHNGDDNKFFTLTTTGTGANASFSGVIDGGYEIGASDGIVSDKKIWVLFPASNNHTYTAGSLPKFFLNPKTDFTATGEHYSANMPMYDLMTDEGDISFKNLCSGFKFRFTNIAAAVNKVMVVVDNNAKTYKFSGALDLALDGGEYCIKPDWGDAGPDRVQSYIANVDKVNNEVVIYVPTRRNTEYFMPVVDLIDYETGNTIKHLVASNVKKSPAKGTVQPLTISAPGTGSFVSPLGVDWTSGSVTTAGDGVHYTGIKAKADADYLYVQLGVYKSMLTINPGYLYANSVNYYFGAASGYFGYLYKNGIPELADAGSSVPEHAVLEVADVVYYEWKCVRATKFSGELEAAGAVSIKFLVYYNNYKPDAGSSTVTDWGSYVYSPEVTVTLP